MIGPLSVFGWVWNWTQWTDMVWFGTRNVLGWIQRASRVVPVANVSDTMKEGIRWLRSKENIPDSKNNVFVLFWLLFFLNIIYVLSVFIRFSSLFYLFLSAFCLFLSDISFSLVFPICYSFDYNCKKNALWTPMAEQILPKLPPFMFVSLFHSHNKKKCPLLTSSQAWLSSFNTNIEQPSIFPRLSTGGTWGARRAFKILFFSFVDGFEKSSFVGSHCLTLIYTTKKR